MEFEERRAALILEAEQLINTAKSENRAFTDEEDCRFAEIEQEAAELNGVIRAECRLAELRYNPYHDPTNGRFTTSSGGGMGAVLHVPMGGKGKGEYVFAKEYSGTDNADFAERNSKFIKESDKKRKNYNQKLKDGDLTTEEYNELISKLPDNIRENGSYTMVDKDNNVIKTTGTLFDYGGRTYGYNHIGNNDFVTDIKTSTFTPLRKYNPSFGEAGGIVPDVIHTAGIADAVAKRVRGNIYDNSPKISKQDKNKLAGLQVELDYARMKAHEYGNAAYGGTKKTRERFEMWNNEINRLTKEISKIPQKEKKMIDENY